jgi:protein-S-isoprenylcysteine O-methyltransferase Ste14
LLTIVLFIARIHQEETVLKADLPGYAQYMQETRYRLLPGLW